MRIFHNQYCSLPKKRSSQLGCVTFLPGDHLRTVTTKKRQGDGMLRVGDGDIGGKGWNGFPFQPGGSCVSRLHRKKYGAYKNSQCIGEFTTSIF